LLKNLSKTLKTLKQKPMPLKMLTENRLLLKNSSESSLWHLYIGAFFLHPMRDRHWDNSTNGREEYIMSISLRIFIIRINFIEANNKVYVTLEN
jgi:hypothetical protein